MTKKTNLPTTAPKFSEGEWIAAFVTVILCAISALALSYHIFDAAPEKMPPEIRWAFTILSGLFAFGMGLVPMMLARAHGMAFEGGTGQTFLGFVVILFIIVDMSLQVHAMHYVIDMMELKQPHIGWLVGISAAFQFAAFMVRGSLYAITKEYRELIEARQHEADMAATYAKERELAARREKYAENKLKVVR